MPVEPSGQSLQHAPHSPQRSKHSAFSQSLSAMTPRSPSPSSHPRPRSPTVARTHRGDRASAAGEGEAQELRALLESERRKVSMLESELKLALTVAQQAEKAHQAELASMDADRKRLLAERRHLLGKLRDTEAVEDSVKELYVQMKDRVAEDGMPTPEQLAQEKAALADEHVLVVLGALHAQLKALWAFKVEAEADLVAGRARRAGAEEGKLAGLRAALHALEIQVRTAHQEVAATNMRAELAEETTANLQEEAAQQVAAMAAQHKELLAQLGAATAEAHAARRAAAAALEEGQRRDALVLATRKLESARHFDRMSQDKELRRLQAAHEVQLRAMHCELHRVSELMAANALQAEQLQATLGTIKQLKQSAQPGRVRDLEHQCRLLEQQLTLGERQRLNARDDTLPPPAPAAATAMHPARVSHSSSAHPARVLPSSVSASGSASGRVTAGALAAVPGTEDAGPMEGSSRAASMARSVAATTALGGGGPLLGGASGSGRGVAAGGGPGKSGSMAARSLALMAAARAAASQAAKEKGKERVDDPMYGLIVNVGVAHKATRSALQAVKHDLAEAGLPGSPTAKQQGSLEGVSAGLGAGAYRALEAQATGHLVCVRDAQQLVGTAGGRRKQVASAVPTTTAVGGGTA